MGCPWWVTGDPRSHGVTSAQDCGSEKLRGYRAGRGAGPQAGSGMEHFPLQSSLMLGAEGLTPWALFVLSSQMTGRRTRQLGGPEVGKGTWRTPRPVSSLVRKLSLVSAPGGTLWSGSRPCYGGQSRGLEESQSHQTRGELGCT